MCYACKMRGVAMRRFLLASLAIAALSSCRKESGSRAVSAKQPAPHDASVEADLSAEIRRREQRAAERDGTRVCERPTAVYEGSIVVNGIDHVHSVARGDDFVDVPIDGLDRILTKSTRVEFTLDYPFERPFAGVVTGEITLRRTIDAVRAGFRNMYEGTTQRDIPGMHNKDVTGPYGRAFHVVDDLVIEGIYLCGDDSFSIIIGS
jgi:hypothetical protein